MRFPPRPLLFLTSRKEFLPCCPVPKFDFESFCMCSMHPPSPSSFPLLFGVRFFTKWFLGDFLCTFFFKIPVLLPFSLVLSASVPVFPIQGGAVADLCMVYFSFFEFLLRLCFFANPILCFSRPPPLSSSRHRGGGITTSFP